MNRICILLIVLFTRANCLIAQSAKTDSLPKSVPESDTSWSFHAEGDYYIYPHLENILIGIVTADRNIGHIEMRYNYEAKNTASVFGGLNFKMGNRLKLILTPVTGLVFGETNGIAPGIEADLRYKIFELSSQTEYLVDFAGKENDYLYTWSEFGITITDQCSAGIAAQRTRLYKTNLDLQRGMYARYTFKKCTAAVYYFNPFSSGYFFVASLAIDFKRF